MARVMQDSVDSILKAACVDGARYQAGDWLGKLLAHVSLCPHLALFYQACIVYNRRYSWAIQLYKGLVEHHSCVCTAGMMYIVLTREIHEAVLLLGALANIGKHNCNRYSCHMCLMLIQGHALAATNRVLKHAIRQARPPSTCEALGMCSKPGMPSSHAQIIFYAFSIFMLQLIRHRQAKLHSTFWQLEWGIKALVYLAISVLVAYSRVYLGYHTVLQVVAGSAAGAVMAALCIAVAACLARIYTPLQQSAFGQMLRLKNTWHIPDVLLHEYTNISAWADGKKGQ